MTAVHFQRLRPRTFVHRNSQYNEDQSCKDAVLMCIRAFFNTRRFSFLVQNLHNNIISTNTSNALGIRSLDDNLTAITVLSTASTHCDDKWPQNHIQHYEYAPSLLAIVGGRADRHPGDQLIDNELAGAADDVIRLDTRGRTTSIIIAQQRPRMFAQWSRNLLIHPGSWLGFPWYIFHQVP